MFALPCLHFASVQSLLLTFHGGACWMVPLHFALQDSLIIPKEKNKLQSKFELCFVI